jgi:hypothetical protein
MRPWVQTWYHKEKNKKQKKGCGCSSSGRVLTYVQGLGSIPQDYKNKKEAQVLWLTYNPSYSGSCGLGPA